MEIDFSKVVGTMSRVLMPSKLHNTQY